jgi:hypothetical protein
VNKKKFYDKNGLFLLSIRFICSTSNNSFFRRLIVEAERRHREVQQRLAQGEEERQTINEKYTNVKEEVEDKRAQRDKLSKQLKKLEAKKLDIIEKHRLAREELEAEQREIQKQVKLFQLIIEHFIPLDERERLFKRVQFDDNHNHWTLTELSKQTYVESIKDMFFFKIKFSRDQMAARPISARSARRPTPLQSQSGSVPEIARFKVFAVFLLCQFIRCENSFRVKILFYLHSMVLVEQLEIMKVQ